PASSSCATRFAVRGGRVPADAGSPLSGLSRHGGRPERRCILAKLARTALLAKRAAGVLLATVGVEHRCRRRFQIFSPLGKACWPAGVLRGCPSEPAFCGPGDRLSFGLCTSGRCIYAVGVVTTRALRPSTLSAASLRGLFFRRCRGRCPWDRERP